MSKSQTFAIFALCVAILISLVAAQDTSCIRNDGINGYCRKPRDCPEIARIMDGKKINGKFTAEEMSYIKKSGSHMCRRSVCCDDQHNVTRGLQELTEQNCGRHDNLAKQIYRPWMALLKTQLITDGTASYSCSGTLIHKRFVLTAATCFNNRHLISVRLGEYDTSTEIDCRLRRGKEICAGPAVDIVPEQLFLHESYSMSSFEYDIALIKLAKAVEFSVNISPICLPLTEESQNALKDIKEFQLTGWGWTHKYNNNNTATIPFDASVAYIEPNQCAKLRPRPASHQLCTDEGDSKDWYRGHSGGPLFSVEYVKDVLRFVQFGIVSVGRLTWREDEPAVQTNVGSFIRWIAFKVGSI